MNNLTFKSRRNRKLNTIKENINLNIDYSIIDKKDIYGFYLTNKTTKNNIKGLPDIGCFVNHYPDFLALETEPGLYFKTNNTCVCWFKDDTYFDTIDGLYNAIIYKDIELLKFYKIRYRNVKYFISIDYSMYGDFDDETLLHNIKKSIICSLWFIFECNAIVFPLMTYGNEATLNWCFDHIIKGSNVAISLKGVMTGENKALFKKALKILIDTKSPSSLLVYTVSSEESSLEMLEYAIKNNIKIIILPNTLLIQNNFRGKHYGQKYK